MQLTHGTYWRYNPDKTQTYVEIQSDRELQYHQDLLDTKGYVYESSS